MSQDAIAEETRRKLEELDQKIKAARSSPGASQVIAGNADKDWQDMVQSHADISRKLVATGNQSAEALEGISLDIDVLRHSFERWMARVEGNFAKDSEGGGKS
jgi:hypothetical protein